MNNTHNIQAFILAGGKSSRMGSEKGLVLLSGKPLVGYIIDTLLKITPHICILANNDLYNHFNFPVSKDIIKEKGPLGGIHTGLTQSKSEINLFVSCDIPFITPALIQFLISNYKNNSALIISHAGITEPLCGIYSTDCKNVIENLLNKNELSMHNALHVLHADIIDVSKELFYTQQLLTNINSPAELKKAEEETA